MKKRLKTLLITLSVVIILCASSFQVFASDGSNASSPESSDPQVTYFMFEDSASAIPLEKTKSNSFSATAASAVSLQYSWGLYVQAGLVGGIDVTVTSHSYNGATGGSYLINYIKAYGAVIQNDGTVTSNYSANTNAATATKSFYAGVPTGNVNRYTSTHTFKCTGYADAIKYVTKYP